MVPLSQPGLKQGSGGLFPAYPTRLPMLWQRWRLSWVWRWEVDGGGNPTVQWEKL